jgi:hypothetical protein
LSIFAGFIAYWRSTNECHQNTTAPANPMKVIRYCDYGSPDVVKLDCIEKPMPNDNHVLFKVWAASHNLLDVYLIRDSGVGRLVFGWRTLADLFSFLKSS